MQPTVGEALAEFRQTNGLSAGEASNAWWSCRLGPVSIRLPNFQWRRRALLAHDLHHVLTGYPCGQAPPNASNLNFAAGQDVPNAVIVSVPTSGPLANAR